MNGQMGHNKLPSAEEERRGGSRNSQNPQREIFSETVSRSGGCDLVFLERLKTFGGESVSSGQGD